MAKEFNQELRATTAEFSKQEKLLASMVKSVQQIEKSYGKISASAGGTGGNMLDGALGKFTTGEKIGMGLAIGGGLIQAGFNALPATQDVLQRATGYYNAGVMQGFNPTMPNGAALTRQGMYKRLADGLGRFGIQSPQATAQLAQFYGTRGVTIGSQFEGNLTAAVGGAATLFNMDSNRAAAALEQLTSGQGSANLLRRMGIFTSNLATGESKTQAQLFSEISARMRAGRGGRAMTVAGVQDSMRKGNLGENLRALGFDEAQQQMFYLSELYRADTGKTLDLSDKNAVDAAMRRLESKGYVNPQKELNAIAASEEGVLEAGTDSYIAGLKAAVPLIQGMNKAMEPLAASMGGLKAAIDALTSTAAGAAAKGFLGDLGGAALTVGAAAAGGALGSKASNFMSSAGKALGVVGKGLGAVGGVIGTVQGTMGAYDSAKQGNGWAVAGNILLATGSAALTGATIGSVIPGLGTAAGAIIGGTIGLVSSGVGALVGGMGAGYDGAGGQTHSQGSAVTRASGKDDEKPKFVRPASGKITSKYGPRKPPAPGASSFHKGVDIASGSGTPIVASSDGTVIFSGMNGGYGNHIKIQHAGGYVTTYSHMSKLIAKKGDRVVAGNQIGSMGTTGISTGVHLHFEVLKGGANIDPATVVPGLGSGSVTATVTSTTPAGKDTQAKEPTSATTSSLPSAGANGVSALAAALGFATSDSSPYVSVPGSNVKFIGPGSVSGTTSVAGSNTSSGQGVSDGKGGPTSVSGGMITQTTSSGGGKNPIVINVNIKQASDAEARRFASLVKDILEDENNLKKIGSI